MSQTRTTLADVAAAAGVSVSTASLAFSEAGPIATETRARVHDAAARLGYAGPNPLGRSLRSGRSGIVAVILGDNLRRAFSDPVAIQVLDGLTCTLNEGGLGVLLLPAPQPGEPISKTPLAESAPMDVAVLLWGAKDTDAISATLARRDVPVIVVEGHAREGVPVITIDDRRGTSELTRHLVSLGHERIAVVTLPFACDRARQTTLTTVTDLGALTIVPTRERYLGMLDAGVKPVAVVEAVASLVEEGQAAGRLLLSGPDRPTAVIAQSDLLAAGVVLAARELGLRVPGDVSIAGFDGLDLPWLGSDVLTTVVQPLREKGAVIGRAVRAILAGHTPETPIMPVSLRLGTTTGPPPA